MGMAEGAGYGATAAAVIGVVVRKLMGYQITVTEYPIGRIYSVQTLTGELVEMEEDGEE
jgi:hypothetical protein